MEKQIKNSMTISKWILFTTLGWIMGFILALLLAEPLDSINLEFFGLGIGISAGIGLMQWIAIKKITTIDSKWVWLTIAGMGSLFLLFDMIIFILKALHFKYQMDGVPFLIIIMIATAFGSYFTGYLQQKYLLNKYFIMSGGWVLNTFLGWTLSSMIIAGYFAVFGRLHFEKTPMGALLNIIVAMIGGPLIGFFTGKKIMIILKTDNILNSL